MKQLIITIMLFLSLNLFGQISNIAVLPKSFFEQLDKMEVENSTLLNCNEGAYFNVIFEEFLKDFDFTGKKVVFLGPGGLVFLDKQKYFDFSKKNNRINQSKLYIFNEFEKKESGGYDAAIVYWNKRKISLEKVVGKLKKISNKD